MEPNFSQHVILPNQILRDALIQMTSLRKGILFVIDTNYQLLGALSDGDVRRALLNNVGLNTPIDKIMNLNPKKSFSIAEAQNLLSDNLGFLEIPVLSSNGFILSIVKMDGIVKNNKLESAEDERSEQKRSEVLAIIPARGGSKRIPKKNISKIGEDSLLGLAIKAAQESRSIDKIIVSTDDEEIASEAQKHGVDVPWLRPAKYATDTAKSIDVVLHAVEQFKVTHGYYPEIGVLLEPTAPLRNVNILEKAMTVFKHNNFADSLVSVNKLRHNFHPEEILTVRDDGFLKPYLSDRTMDNRKLRGEQNELFVQNGLVYLFRIPMLLEKKSLYGEKSMKFETPEELFLDIDTFRDLNQLKKLILSNSSPSE